MRKPRSYKRGGVRRRFKYRIIWVKIADTLFVSLKPLDEPTRVWCKMTNQKLQFKQP